MRRAPQRAFDRRVADDGHDRVWLRDPRADLHVSGGRGCEPCRACGHVQLAEQPGRAAGQAVGQDDEVVERDSVEDREFGELLGEDDAPDYHADYDGTSDKFDIDEGVEWDQSKKKLQK